MSFKNKFISNCLYRFYTENICVKWYKSMFSLNLATIYSYNNIFFLLYTNLQFSHDTITTYVYEHCTLCSIALNINYALR